MSIIQNILHYHLQLYFGEKKSLSNIQINILYKTFLNFMHLELTNLGKPQATILAIKGKLFPFTSMGQNS